jgi:hypothetical protein
VWQKPDPTNQGRASGLFCSKTTWRKRDAESTACLCGSLSNTAAQTIASGWHAVSVEGRRCAIKARWSGSPEVEEDVEDEEGVDHDLNHC